MPCRWGGLLGRSQIVDCVSYADFIVCVVQNSLTFPHRREIPFNGVRKFDGT
jgi:hypothetical protein